MQTYAVDMNECGPMILDALIKVSDTPFHSARAGCFHLHARCLDGFAVRVRNACGVAM